MTREPMDGTQSGSGGRHRESQPPPETVGASGDWFHVVTFEWMWRDDGLALRPGPELMVYATIYRASAHGGGTFYATNASMGRMLGYPRETVNRTIRKLLDAGLVWVVGTVSEGRGGRPVRCYAVSQAPIDRVLAGLSARRLDGREACARDRETGGLDEKTQAKGNVTEAHVAQNASDGGFRQGVTRGHIGASQRDAASRLQCDGSSHVTEPHIAQNGLPPAQTELFDISLISSYHLSTDQPDGKEADQVTCNGATLDISATDMAAFRSLLDKSVLPVDAGYVDGNLKAFAQLVGEGIPADVIIAAYDDYAAYQRRMEAELGESRPMHLLKWLRQSPNKNIQYVLNSRDEEWLREHPIAARRCATGGRGKPAKRSRPTHENPDLSKCRDRGRALWFVTDERGARIVRGSEGVESVTQARELYQRMYENEGLRVR